MARMIENEVTTVTPDRVAVAMLQDSKYVLVDAAGACAARNEFGKATPFAFQQRGIAFAHAARRGVFVITRGVGTQIRVFAPRWEVRS